MRCRLTGGHVVAVLAVLGCMGAGWAESAAPSDATDPAQQALENIRAADLARSATDSEASAWDAERERLQALLDTYAGEARHLRGEVAKADQASAAATAAIATIGNTNACAMVRSILEGAAHDTGSRLVSAAAASLPGAIVSPAAVGTDLDEVIRDLAASEQAAGSVGIEVITGQLHGQEVAVKMLRVSGAAAWWQGMDGHGAGSVAMEQGHPLLIETADEAQESGIKRAIAIVEGRQAAGVVLLSVDADRHSQGAP